MISGSIVISLLTGWSISKYRKYSKVGWGLGELEAGRWLSAEWLAHDSPEFKRRKMKSKFANGLVTMFVPLANHRPMPLLALFAASFLKAHLIGSAIGLNRYLDSTLSDPSYPVNMIYIYTGLWDMYDTYGRSVRTAHGSWDHVLFD